MKLFCGFKLSQNCTVVKIIFVLPIGKVAFFSLTTSGLHMDHKWDEKLGKLIVTGNVL